MSTRTKVILVLVAVLLVALFAGAIGNQGGTGTGDSGSRNGLVDLLGRWAGDANAVAADDIEAPCRKAPGTVQFSGSCTLTVAAGGTGLRSLVLRSDHAMTVKSRVPRKDSTVSDDVEPGNEIKVAIDEKGGAVELRCLAPPPATCVVTLGNGS